MSLDLLIGVLLGLSISVVVYPLALRRFLKNKLALRKLISEIYHKYLLPEVCRIEGLIDLEYRATGSELLKLALDEVREHKRKIIEVIKKYEPLQ